jgi:hypothetical protein
MTLLEIAARSVLLAEYGETILWPELSLDNKHVYMEIARSVIESIREPSKEMIEAGLDILYRSGTIEIPLDSDAYLVIEIFQAMIDVAIIERCTDNT